MKKLLFIFAVMFFGCTENSGILSTCKTCTTTVKMQGNPSESTTAEFCDGKWKEIDGKTTVTYTNIRGAQVAITTTTVCK